MLHLKCEGNNTRRSAFYTRKMVKRLVYYMQREVHEETKKAISRDSPLDKTAGSSDMSVDSIGPFELGGIRRIIVIARFLGIKA